MIEGKIVQSGDFHLVESLEKTGYDPYLYKGDTKPFLAAKTRRQVTNQITNIGKSVESYFSEYLLELQDEAQASDLSFRRAALDAFHSYGMPRRKPGSVEICR